MIRIFLITVLLAFSFNINAQQEVDSFYVKIDFQDGFFISKKAVIKVNKEVVFKKKIKTIRQLSFAGEYNFYATSEDKIIIRIGFFRRKLKIDRIINSHYVWVNRCFLFNTYSYHKKPAFYD